MLRARSLVSFALLLCDIVVVIAITFRARLALNSEPVGDLIAGCNRLARNHLRFHLLVPSTNGGMHFASLVSQAKRLAFSQHTPQARRNIPGAKLIVRQSLVLVRPLKNCEVRIAGLPRLRGTLIGGRLAPESVMPTVSRARA
jgi:hypothetical protein